MIPALFLSAPLLVPQCSPEPPWLFRVGPTRPATTIGQGLSQAAAYAASNPGVVPKVLVDPGTYVENLLLPSVDLVLEGNPFAQCGTVIDGGNAVLPVIRVGAGHTAATRVLGFTIQNGSGLGGTVGAFGGGIHVSGGSSPVIERNVIQHNLVQDAGGGIYVNASSPRIAHNVFRDNVAEGDGGGIALEDGCAAVIESNRFVTEADSCAEWADAERNMANFIGGAIACLDGDGSIVRGNYIRGCRARAGGGIGVLDSAPLIEGNVIVENGVWDSVDFGGGVHLEGSAGVLLSNVIALNGGIAGEECAAALEGGGLFVTQSSTAIVNNTIYGNLAREFSTSGDSHGGGVAMEFASGTFVNNLIWDNYAEQDPDVSKLFSGSLVQHSNSIEVGGGSGDFSHASHGMIDPAGLDFHLRWDAEQRDVASLLPGLSGVKDFEGDPRVHTLESVLLPDVGADEFAQHVYHVGETVTPTGAGVLRVIARPGATVGVWYSGWLLPPALEVPVGGSGTKWKLGTNGAPECPWQDQVADSPLFLAYADGAGYYHPVGSPGYAEYVLPGLAQLACQAGSSAPYPLTVYLQSLVDDPQGTLAATNAHALVLE